MKQILHYILFLSTLVTLCVGCTDDDDYYYYKNIGTVSHSTVASLFVATDRHDNGAGNNLTALLQTTISNIHVTPPATILLGGDYVGSGGDKSLTGQPVFNVSDMKSEIARAMGNDNNYRTLFTYGSHDKGASEGLSAFFSGPTTCDGYYAYGISFAQMYYATDSATMAVDTLYKTVITPIVDEITQDTIGTDSLTEMIINKYDGIDLADPFGISAARASQLFSTWVNNLTDHAPIVIMSHMPMHVNRKDNSGALTWFNAISKAAEKHDIIVFFGHNHTLEEHGNDADAYHYLLIPGDSINIQGMGITEKRSLNFTYANAGYIKLGFATLVTFRDNDNNGSFDSMTLLRCNVNGAKEEHFGLTDKRNPYTLYFRR